MKKFLMSCLMLTGSAWAIDVAHSMDEVGGWLQRADGDTLVVWDVDMVLIHPQDPAFQMGSMVRYRDRFHRLFGSLDADQQALALSSILIRGEAELLEPSVLDLLADLTKRLVPQVALTGCLTGSLGDCPSLEGHRIEGLAKLGISFADVAPLKGDCDFTEMPTYRGYPVMYRSGVIFANGIKGPKGDALVCYLERLDTRPRAITFIDDRLPYLEDVETKLKAYDSSITFTGIHYQGAKHIESPFVTEEAFCEAWQGLVGRALELGGGGEP